MFVCKLYARQRRTNSTVTSLHWSVFVPSPAVVCNNVPITRGRLISVLIVGFALCVCCQALVILPTELPGQQGYVCTATSLHWSVLCVPIDPSPAITCQLHRGNRSI